MDQPIQPSIPEPVIIESTPSKKSYKWLIVAIIIFLLASASVFAYKYYQLNQKLTQTQPSPAIIVSPEPLVEAETADWKKYTDSINGFSFQYPQELLLTENCSLYAKGDYLICLQSSNFSYNISEPDNKLNESKVVSQGFGLFIQQVLQDYPYEISTLQEDYQRSNNDVTLVIINGTPMLKISSKNSLEEIRWVILHNKNVYNFFSPSNTQNYPIIDQILSTFKFTKAMTEEEAISLIKASYPEVREIQQTGGAFNSSSDIKTKKEVTLWKLVFNQGSGDCPSGCINNQYWYFTVDNDKNIIKVGEYERIFVPKTNSYTETGSPLWNFLD